MSVCSVLVDDGNLCGEAPIWDADEESVYWTDAVARKFYRLDWHSKKRELVLDEFEINGCALDQSGGLVFVNNAGVWLWDKRSRPLLLCEAAEKEKLQLNDCIADSHGRLLTGSCFYSPIGQYALGKLFCIEPDGKIEILDDGFHLANGLGFSPDGSTLYFTDSVARTIYAYSYEPKSGRVRDRRVFAKTNAYSGIPDGLTVDAAGFVWSAEWYGSCISRYDADGKLDRRISVPAKQTSSIAFGGRDLCDIFITSAAGSEPMPVMPVGYDPKSGYFGGALFHLNQGIRGRAEHRTRMGA